jgi:DNA-binding GntR family transcriptional regulator
MVSPSQASRGEASSGLNPLSGLTPRNRQRSAGEESAQFVRRLIYSGQLQGGDRVPQRDVARLLGLSKIPVREGLIALEREGLVTFGAGRGAIVNRLDREAIQDGFDIFGMVYSYAVCCAYQRGGDAFVSRAVELCTAIRAAAQSDDQLELVVAFHKAVVVAAGSPRIDTVLGATARVEVGDIFFEIPALAAIEVGGINAIVRALRRGDPDRAGMEYRRLLRLDGEAAIEELRRRGLFDVPASP